jgi:porphobilinogen deaminase
MARMLLALALLIAALLVPPARAGTATALGQGLLGISEHNANEANDILLYPLADPSPYVEVQDDRGMTAGLGCQATGAADKVDCPGAGLAQVAVVLGAGNVGRATRRVRLG